MIYSFMYYIQCVVKKNVSVGTVGLMLCSFMDVHLSLALSQKLGVLQW